MGEKIRVNRRKTDGIEKHTHFGTVKSNTTATYDSPFSEILHLQRTIGNRAVTRLIQSGAIQAKLKIGQPDDIYEQEADRVADQVMRMPDQAIQRQAEEEEEEKIQTKPLADQITPLVQRQVVPEEEEEVQTKLMGTGQLQRQEEVDEEEKELAGASLPFANAVGQRTSIDASEGSKSPAAGTTIIRGTFPPRKPREMWYFNGERPPNYTVSMALNTNRAGGTFNWSVSHHLRLSSPTVPNPTITTIARSNARRDAWVRVRHTDNSGTTTAASFRLTVLEPDSLNHLRNADTANATWGYESRIHYSILDQFGTTLPRDVPINEQWTSGVVPDFPRMTWRRGPAGSATVPPANWHDLIQGEHAGAHPTPVGPRHASAGVPVYHWDGDWRVGSLAIGRGSNVSSVTWQKNRGFARHT